MVKSASFMRLPVLISVVTLSASCNSPAQPTSDDPEPPARADSTVYDFEDDETGTIPAGFTQGLTGGGGPVVWQVLEVEDAPSGSQVVVQLSDDRTNARYPHLVREDFEAKDVDLSVKFKTMSGDVDASGGLIFRYLDKDNFYVVRANALEDNVVAYKTENGKRSNIGVKGRDDAYGVEIEVPHQAWNSLRVVARGDLFEIYLNGRKVFEVEDSTFTEAGRIGLWTKADAVTQFDELAVAAMRAE